MCLWEEEENNSSTIGVMWRRYIHLNREWNWIAFVWIVFTRCFSSFKHIQWKQKDYLLKIISSTKRQILLDYRHHRLTKEKKGWETRQMDKEIIWRWERDTQIYREKEKKKKFRQQFFVCPFVNLDLIGFNNTNKIQD